MAIYYWVGGTGTWSGTGNTQFAVTSGGVATLLNPTNADTVNFDANSGTAATITVDASAVSLSTTINKSDINLSLSGSPTLCTSTGTLTLTAGTITLNSFTLSTGFFTSNNSNARTLAFGTGNITVTGNNTNIWLSQTLTNLTVSGSRTVNCTYSGGVGQRNIFHGTTAGSLATALDFNISAGTDIVDMRTWFRNLNFTGFAGSVVNNNRFVSGNLTVSTGMTFTAGASSMEFNGTSGIQQITTNGKTLDFPLTFGGVGGTFQLQDDLTLGSTRTSTLTSGTLDLNNRTMTVESFASNNSNVRAIQFGSGSTLVVVGSGATAFNATNGTNLTTSGTGVISMTSASAKTFVGGGRSYPTLNQGGAGALTITEANTFANITNTVQPATITFPASTTTTVSVFNVSGTSGNLITINSSTPGTRATLSDASGVNSVSFCDIKDINATGGAIWNAYVTNNNVNVSNNVGWDFYLPVNSIYDSLRLRGYTGTVTDMLLQYYKANGATSNSLQDAESEFLIVKGFTFGSNTDKWFAYLRSLSFTGTVTDMLFNYWKDPA
jgi:hypothetical protein